MADDFAQKTFDGLTEQIEKIFIGEMLEAITKDEVTWGEILKRYQRGMTRAREIYDFLKKQKDSPG